LSARRNAPVSLSARLEEEWLADLEGRRGAIARLRFAMGCCRATRVIALELGAPVRAAAAAGGRSATLFGEPGASILSRRTTVFALIGILHVLVILGLASGMTREVSQAVPPRIQATLESKPASRPEPLPLSNPRLLQLRPDVPPLHWTDATPEGAITPQAADSSASAAVTAATPGQVVRVIGGPGRGFPNTADYYPAPSIRLAEKGVATVRVCVDGAGRLTADPAIAQSSGSARLDAGALRLAKAGSGHYQPSTEGGRPVSSCYPFGIRFELK
jgi:TonB family protein